MYTCVKRPTKDHRDLKSKKTLQHTATRKGKAVKNQAFDDGLPPLYTLQHTATHCNTLQHTATHCNTLQHTATHCNTQRSGSQRSGIWWWVATTEYTATHCNTLQHSATRKDKAFKDQAFDHGLPPLYTLQVNKSFSAKEPYISTNEDRNICNKILERHHCIQCFFADISVLFVDM